MPTPPACTQLGRHCRELSLTVHISDLAEDTATEQDASGTWLIGHTERISFGRPYVRAGQFLVDAVVRVGCKYLIEKGEKGQKGETESKPAKVSPSSPVSPAVCKAHGYRGPVPDVSPAPRRVFQHGPDRFTLVHRRQLQTLDLPLKRAAKRALPVLQDNPCVGAPCRTADNKVGAACCRDLTLDVATPSENQLEEALLRSRKSPYLCKVKRTDPTTVECEVISACGYLCDDGVSCRLHDRTRPNGRPAKPEICSDWPDFEDDDEYTGHPGCVFLDD